LFSIAITDRQNRISLDRRRIRRAVRAVLQDAGVAEAMISVAVVDDATIAELHGRFLDDPTPTDVLSFVLERSPQVLEGEVVVSADAARTNARKYSSTAERELLLYVIHGALHLVGHDDATPRQRALMQKREREYVARSGAV
jgi:probable rRNA maturation factor